MMQQEIEFVKCNPIQNMTILVQSDHLSEDYVPIASKLMAYENLFAEQVGFIKQAGNDKGVIELQMAGGEFCGNACMSLAAYAASVKKLNVNETKEITLESSGTRDLVTCQVTKRPNEYYCQVSMPMPKKVEERTVTFLERELNIAIVRYEAFTHIVLEVDQFSIDVKERAESLSKLLGIALGTNLIAILLYKPETGELNPLVYVPHLDSLIWERGCGSGAASLGAYLSYKRCESLSTVVNQPGGTIRVTAEFNHHVLESLKIESNVEIVAQGTAYINVEKVK